MTTPPSGLITLTTDFGVRDAYVAVMKGVILRIHPGARLVDVTHEVAPQDIMEAAFVLQRAAPFFPPGTVHLAVVDPGVGTERRAVALRDGEQWYVGPDNGLFTLVLERRTPDELVVLDRPAFWRCPEASHTFHGRDIFAPVAAHLSAGRPLSDLGSPLEALAPMHWALPIADDKGIRGWVVHIDHFGNCVTNIGRALLEKHRRGRGVKCYAGAAILRSIHDTYSAVDDGEALALFESSDFLEIAVNAGNAADLLGIRRGAPVHVLFT